MTTSSKGSLLGLMRLTRVSLAPSAIADSAAGAALAAAAGASADAGRAAAALAASALLFSFGMALNDLCDREKDARTRPERPIPSGVVPLRLAATIVLATGLLAFACAAFAPWPTIAIAASIAACIVAYDVPRGHLGTAGPLVLGLIRGQNLLLGAAALGDVTAALPVAFCHGAYVLFVSYFARMEDGEVALSRFRARLLPRLASLSMVGAAIVASRGLAGPSALSAGLVVLWAVIRGERALAGALSVDQPSPRALQRVVGTYLSGIVLLDAAIALAAGTTLAGVAILVLFPVGRLLVRRIPPS